MELIRDNLIQNGISFPTKSFEKYEDCFFVSERLASLSWFLFVNNVSGSTIGEGYALFPQQTYKQKIRSLVYAEYVDVGKDFAGMMLPRRRTDDVDSNFNFLSKSQARVSPFGEQYSKVESAGNEFLDLVKKSQETGGEADFDSWEDFDVETVEEPEAEEDWVDSKTDIDIANLVEDEDGFLVDEDSLEASGNDSNGFEDGSNEREDWVSEDSEDDFEDWGSGDSEEDDFESWDDSDDVFESWGTDDSEVEDDADFDDWGSSDEIEEDSDDWESPSEDSEDDFDDWDSSDDSEDLDTEFEDDADFDDWGSDEEDEQDEELEDDADFDDWGSSDEDGEEEDFDDWGSSEEVEPKVTKGTPSKQIKRSPASELKAETEMMDFFERGVNSLFRSTVSNGKKFGRRFASLPENEKK